MACMDRVYQVAMLPFRRRWPQGSPDEQPDLIARTDEYNAAAEQYYARFPASEYLLDKPFSETQAASKHLIDVGVLIEAMRLKPGDRVAELGAGSCWLSQMLNRFGCRTVALDVSPTALALGRTLFERDPRTNWSLDPQFLTYDGHHLPLETGSCDRVVINDAFHHIPNQRELLLEMCRILNADGVVAMSEPGRGHGSSAQSLEEAATTGVLENELVLHDLDALARACGFASVCVLASTPRVRHEIPARHLGAFMGGRGFAEFWKAFCSGLEQHHYILCYKGPAIPTTRRPGRLDARIERPAGDRVVEAQAGEPVHLPLRLTNTGDTRWLEGAAAGVGWTRVGAHLFTAGESRALIDFDWYRADLPGDIEPGAAVEIRLVLPSVPAAGAYVVVIDLVVEGTTWFAERGSRAAVVPLRVASQ
jgi:SAM-dependent methyltransferase